MNTELSDTTDGRTRGWVCYDAACALCRGGAHRFRRVLENHGFVPVPLQSHAVRRRLNLSGTELLAEVRVIAKDGAVFGGADALLYLAKRIPWAWPLFALGLVPGMKPVLRAAYRWLARNRYRFGGACELSPAASPTRSTWPAWVPLVVLTSLALVVGPKLPAWGFMWTLALAIFAGCKWLTYRDALANGAHPTPLRTAGYLLAWPGMDAKSFLARRTNVYKPAMSEWLFAFGRIAVGTTLLWRMARVCGNDLLSAWVGMVGLIFILHFGLFHLLSLAWRRAGVNAPPLMRAPVLANSAGEFWGARWNTGFHQLANNYLFRPLRTKVGSRIATMTVFAVSGLIHELVISLPARGGYGLPTLYFVSQGAAVLFERIHPGRRLGLGRGIRGRLIMLIVTAGPAFWLFHPPFALNVMIPFLKSLNAI